MIAALQDWLRRERVRRKTLKCLNQIPCDFGGGCADRKALLMADLICRFNLTTTVDIGVYRGRSFFPQAIAHRYCTGGVVYGVDPYDRGAAQQSDNAVLRQQLDAFISVTDFDAIYDSVADRINQWSLSRNASLVRRTSAEAADDFRDRHVRCDLVHIDGNHDTQSVLADLDAYVPLLSDDGFLVMDDVNWDSVRPAYLKAAEQLVVVYEQAEYAVFCQSRSPHIEPARDVLRKYQNGG
ncbi:MAG TPA: class I SAM-dependent methyltransferase [Pirellulales bacterium]|nr:class I SAM-dependent methyltransferase [Pirellulales bacterium]